MDDDPLLLLLLPSVLLAPIHSLTQSIDLRTHLATIVNIFQVTHIYSRDTNGSTPTHLSGNLTLFTVSQNLYNTKLVCGYLKRGTKP